jgi:hypothetical protein
MELSVSARKWDSALLLGSDTDVSGKVKTGESIA